jgi:hypothetical protein
MSLNGDMLENRLVTKKQLRLRNITTKAALKFGSEAWVLKKRDEPGLKAA